MESILPKSKEKFSDKKYWESFFQKRSKSFEWYGDYMNLLDLFAKYVKCKDNVLVIGCGNSTLSADLKTVHKCKAVCSIDTSATVIKQMRQKHRKTVVDGVFEFAVADAAVDWSASKVLERCGPFSCVVDKGTTDAIYSSEEGRNVAVQMWEQISKNLANVGRYVLVTLAQEHIVMALVDTFCVKNDKCGWITTVHEICSIKSESGGSFELPVFAFVFCKMSSSLPGLPRVFVEENSFMKLASASSSSALKRQLTDPATELPQWIQQRQKLSIMCHSSRTSKDADTELDMLSVASGRVRYHCVFVNIAHEAKKRRVVFQMPYCVFIVPFMEHRSPLFCDRAALQRMCRDHLRSAQCLFVFLNPLERYGSKQAVQDELHSVALRFCPDTDPDSAGSNGGYSVPYVSSDVRVYDRVDSASSRDFELVETASYGRLHRWVDSQGDVLCAEQSLSWSDDVFEEVVGEIRRLQKPSGMKSNLVFIGRACSKLVIKSTILVTSVVVRDDGTKLPLRIVRSVDDVQTTEGAIVVCFVPTLTPSLLSESAELAGDSGAVLVCCDDNELNFSCLTNVVSSKLEDPLFGTQLLSILPGPACVMTTKIFMEIVQTF